MTERCASKKKAASKVEEDNAAIRAHRERLRQQWRWKVRTEGIGGRRRVVASRKEKKGPRDLR